MVWPFRKKPQVQARKVQIVRARYDAAQTTTGNANWWAGADSLSAKQANNPAVREKLRNRSRYEIANNSYAAGIVRTIAEDVIGTGPRLQMLGLDAKDSLRIEKRFKAWCREIGLADKLITMRRARTTDGETFAAFIENPRLQTPVKLDLRIYEANQVHDPQVKFKPDGGDGISFDGFGNPVSYTVLRDEQAVSGKIKTDTITAANMIHDFKADRPGQVRGIPELVPSLGLFAQMRAYTLATVEAAEAIASFAMVAYTDHTPDDDGADDVAAFEEIELSRRMLTHLPRGWKLGQPKPEQPSSTYSEFKRELITEIARCLNMPYNKAAGDSSNYNYASGRLDHQSYFRSIKVDQERIGRIVLDRLFYAWFKESIAAGELPRRLSGPSVDLSHNWHWDGNEHVDPQKEANAQKTRLTSMTTNLSNEYAKEGKDWEVEVRQLAKERKLLAELGLSDVG